MRNLLALIVYLGVTAGFAATVDHHRPAFGVGRSIMYGLCWPLWVGDALGHYALSPYPGEHGVGEPR